MNKSKIEWCDQTWNPVTGCYHNCPYCYARGIARRFEGKGDLRESESGLYLDKTCFERLAGNGVNGIYEIKYPLTRGDRPDPCEPYKGRRSPYPFGFDPTFHRYRLDEPQRKKKPQNIFVCSMADLFGSWVPDEWIQKVFDVCVVAPQHRYLFLTKNPERYWQINSEDNDTKPLELYETAVPLQIYLGVSVTNNKQFDKAHESPADWISIEPLLEELYTENFMDLCYYSEVPRWKWVVIGAETGNRKDRVVPQREWIEAIVEECRHWKTPVFMKNSLAEIWGKSLIQEYPWKETA